MIKFSYSHSVDSAAIVLDLRHLHLKPALVTHIHKLFDAKTSKHNSINKQVLFISTFIVPKKSLK